VSALIPAAETAWTVGGQAMALAPPPGFAGRIPVLTGLRNLAFVHETVHGVVGITRGPPMWQRVLDSTVAADATLADLEQRARRRRRSPLYWGDRILRAVLGFPAYLLGLILGVPATRIDQGGFGVVLRVVPVASLGVALYFGGRDAGWW